MRDATTHISSGRSGWLAAPAVSTCRTRCRTNGSAPIVAALGCRWLHARAASAKRRWASTVRPRLDRTASNDARLHQEDVCQALGVPPRRKYQADGGPGMAKCLQLLAGSADAPQDTLAFQLTQLAFWLMAATDGHAKNYSIFLHPGDRYVMTPLYDILSMWPYFGSGPTSPSPGMLAWRDPARKECALQAGDDPATAGNSWREHGGPAVWKR